MPSETPGKESLARPLVSAVIITHNSTRVLPACLDSLFETDYSPLEVIVVDNESTDGTVGLVRSNPQPVTIIANEKGVGPNAGFNQGARLASGRYVAWLNPDIVFPHEWLGILVDRMESTPDAAIITPTTLYPEQSRGPLPTPAVIEAATVPGCAALIRAEAWRALGGLDEKIFMAWGDTEFCWRAWLCGWRVLEDREAYVYHERGGSSLSPQRFHGEEIEGGLRTYLKLMRWRRVAPFLTARVAKTVAKKILFPRHRLFGAWVDVGRDLDSLMAERRRLSGEARGDRRRLERMISAHTRRQLQERAEHWWSSRRTSRTAS